MLCGTDPHPEHFRAKKYRIQEHFITRQDFAHIMRNLPEKVSEEDIEEMFSFADKDQDGKISYAEFQVMICPQQPRPDTAKGRVQKFMLGKLVDFSIKWVCGGVSGVSLVHYGK